MAKPTIVLVPGAWHSPSHYELLLATLRDSGYVTKSQKLPSVDASEPKKQTTAADAEFVRQEVLLPELDQGKDVILVMHSYGGSPGAAAAKGLSKAERAAEGKEGGIIGLVFVCAFLAGEGDSLRSKLPGNKLDPWNIVNEQTGQIDVDNPKEIFYGNVDQASAQKAIEGLRFQALESLITPSTAPAWPDSVFDGRRAYVQCTQDKAIPVQAQHAMVNFSGVTWQTKELKADHSPFLTHAEDLKNFINELSQSWSA